MGAGQSVAGIVRDWEVQRKHAHLRGVAGEAGAYCDRSNAKECAVLVCTVRMVCFESTDRVCVQYCNNSTRATRRAAVLCWPPITPHPAAYPVPGRPDRPALA